MKRPLYILCILIALWCLMDALVSKHNRPHQLSGQPVDKLDPWYQAYNEKYFDNELPKEILITHDLHNHRRMAQTDPGTIYHIEINPEYTTSSKVEMMLLFHEMCHVHHL